MRPYDLQESKVLDTRLSKDGMIIRRRRECLHTGRRFTTEEQIIREGVYVVKRDGRRETFERDKIVNGIRKATEKRPIDAEQIEILINDVMDSLEERYATEIPSHVIGEAIMDRLKHVDHIAYVRFACVYKDFRDLAELQEDLKALDLPSAR